MQSNGPSRRSAGRVAAIITTYNHAHFLADAIDSVLAQTISADEVIVVDDGSTDDPAAVVADYPSVRLIRRENGGLSAARNTGLRSTDAEFVLFLDADDRLLPAAIEQGLILLRERPDIAFAYGGYRYIDAIGQSISAGVVNLVDGDGYQNLLRGNMIGMHATVLFRRDHLMEVGGYDESLRRCEDYDIYLRLAAHHPIGSYSDIVAEYRWHGANMSADPYGMLGWALRVHRRYKPSWLQFRSRLAWLAGRTHWRDYYAAEVFRAAAGDWRTSKDKKMLLQNAIRTFRSSPLLALRKGPRQIVRWIGMAPKRKAETRVRALGDEPVPAVGKVDFGDFKRLQPISSEFGYDRGTPVDRYYIESFLEQYSEDIKGRALEIGDASYTRRFGQERVTAADVLHVNPGNPEATFVGDLTDPDALPADAFDCMVLTQTLHLIYDMPLAIRMIHRALKPGGVALVTVPGITSIDRGEWHDHWCWSLTDASARRLAEEAFRPQDIQIRVYGNVYSAVAFLQGLAFEEVSQHSVDFFDPAYPVTIGVRLEKARLA